MRTRVHKKQNVNLITLGCSKNTIDSEVLFTQLAKQGVEVYHNSTDYCEVSIINTCGFIENAKKQSIDMILEHAELKKKGLVQKLYVMGCLSERYKEELSKSILEVDGYFGSLDIIPLLKELGTSYKEKLLGERISSTPSHYAYLKISEGCNRPCSFCAIPLMRGKHISKPMPSIIEEAKFLVKNGVKEILLIAQDTTYYGIDLYKKRCLTTLLESLSSIKGLEWIRIHYAFPTGFPTDVLSVIANSKNICNYIDIPLQHASNKILKLMRRGTTNQKTRILIKKIRDSVPGISIRTTFIVGHPHETDSDFEETLDFIQSMKFERLGVFMYSHEEDTHSHTMPDNVPENIKEERFKALMEIQEKISTEHNKKKVNSLQKVLIDRQDHDYWVGRTESDSPEVDNEVLIKYQRRITCRNRKFCNCKNNRL